MVTLPTPLPTRDGAVVLREAVAADLPALVALLADDQLGATRDGVDGPDGIEPYRRALAAIDVDPAHLLLVAEDGGEVVATAQLSLLPGLARRGALRAQVEAVRVRADHRGSGLGAALVTWTVEEARRRGCALVQLTSDKQREDAHRFYSRLGFTASHEGFKLTLPAAAQDVSTTVPGDLGGTPGSASFAPVRGERSGRTDRQGRGRWLS